MEEKPMDFDAGNVWSASEARANFARVLERAAGGTPQLIRQRGGAEVVVASTAAFAEGRPGLKEYLMRGGEGGDGSSLEDFLRSGG